MGWIWKDDDADAPSSWGLSSAEGETHSTRKVVRSNCRTEEVEPGKFVRKCEKTEQILRDCVGRPAEVLESKTEHTEEDVTEEMSRSAPSFGPSGMEPFSFPGLRNDIEAIERGMLGGLNTFLQEAEEMKNELFQSFGIPPSYRKSPPFHGQIPIEEPQIRFDTPQTQRNGAAYDEFAGNIREI